MKNVILLIFSFGLFISNTNAQTQLGAKAGLDLSNMHGDPYPQPTMKAGFHAGLYLDLPAWGNYSIQPGLVFSQKGAKGQGDEIDALLVHHKYSFQNTYNFIEMPVLANIKVSSSFNLLFGPQLSFLVSTKGKIKGSPESYSVDDVGTKTYVGLVAGSSYYPWKSIGFMLQYAMDLQNHTFYSSQEKNTVIQMGLGYKFNNSKKTKR